MRTWLATLLVVILLCSSLPVSAAPPAQGVTLELPEWDMSLVYPDGWEEEDVDDLDEIEAVGLSADSDGGQAAIFLVGRSALWIDTSYHVIDVFWDLLALVDGSADDVIFEDTEPVTVAGLDGERVYWSGYSTGSDVLPLEGYVYRLSAGSVGYAVLAAAVSDHADIYLPEMEGMVDSIVIGGATEPTLTPTRVRPTRAPTPTPSPATRATRSRPPSRRTPTAAAPTPTTDGRRLRLRRHGAPQPVVPTRTPAPTDTPLPTATPAPTDTATPVPTNTPLPTTTPTPTNTATPLPTNTPVPTKTPTSTATSLPTNTPVPTTTPTSTATSLPTNTPVPTKTPTPTNTPMLTATRAATATRTVASPMAAITAAAPVTRTGTLTSTAPITTGAPITAAAPITGTTPISGVGTITGTLPMTSTAS